MLAKFIDVIISGNGAELEIRESRICKFEISETKKITAYLERTLQGGVSFFIKIANCLRVIKPMVCM